MIIEINDEERELIVFGLHMRKNWIETGNPLLSSQDAKNVGKEKIIKSLDRNQHLLIVMLEVLIQKIEKAV